MKRRRTTLRVCFVFAAALTKCHCFVSFATQRSRFPTITRQPPRLHNNLPETFRARRLNLGRLWSNSGWKAGDVYQDLYNLEQSIAFANAENTLVEKERIETMNAIAKQRRPIAPDLIRFIMSPLLGSFILASLLKVSQRKSTGRLLIRSLTSLSMAHFAVCLVLAPFAAYCVKRLRRQTFPEDEFPAELKGLSSAYRQLVTTNWVDPLVTCRDHVLCLLEQWMSAVTGIALMGPFLVWLLPYTVYLSAQTAVRVSVLASLHQYPKLWYDLTRSDQPRPMRGSVVALQSLTRTLFTPWTTAVDVACLASQLSWPMLWQCYVAGLVASGLAAAAAHFATPNRKKLATVLEFRPPVKSMLRAAAIVWILGRRQYAIDATINAWNLFQLPAREFLICFPWRKTALSIAVFVACVAPACHLWAGRKLIRFDYMHGLSLAMETETFTQSMEELVKQQDQRGGDSKSKAQGLKWRYWLTWREPQRIRVTLDQWYVGFWYWLILSGSVGEQLDTERRNHVKSLAWSGHQTIWQTMAEEQARNPNAPRPDRSKWKQNAMNNIAKKHIDNYEMNRIVDPLGIYVQQTFGIGLGFNYEHMSELTESELPDMWRLQSRAAKSAIVRAHEIFNATVASEELGKITDPKERNKRARELQAAPQKEIKFLAKRLSELVPTDLSSIPVLAKNETVEQFTLQLPSDRVRRSPAIENLLKSQRDSKTQEVYEIDYLNPMGQPSIDSEDKEFMQEWSNRHLGNGSQNTKQEGDSEEDGVKTVLA